VIGNSKSFLLVALLAFCLPACGYRFGRGEILQRYSTVCVPYAEGDNEGLFTAALVRSVITRGCLAYRSCGADLVLKVCLVKPTDINIGFIYAPPDVGDNEASNIVVSNEARLTLAARVSLIDRCTGQCVVGPMEIISSLDYDFEPDLGNDNFHTFSLGQLEMHNLAQDAAFPPLYTLLAEKIVDYVNNSW
jgi:hypothetical protein